jgi:glycosyltransferase involved in cell wall biosynthesis
MIPELFGWDLTAGRWFAKQRSMATASTILAVSHTTMSDIIRLRPNIPAVRSGRVVVAHNGIDPKFSPSSLSAVKAFRARHSVPHKPYIIVVGARMGYKRIWELYSALRDYFAMESLTSKADFISRVLHRIQTETNMTKASQPVECRSGVDDSQEYSLEDLTLIMVGGGAPHGIELQHLKGVPSWKHIGQISDEELVAAYTGALSLVYLSSHEGFGLPIVEAMSCGCPVIAADIPIVREIGGDAVIHVNTSDPQDIMANLQLLLDPQVHQTVREASLAHSRKYAKSWSEMSGALENLFEHARSTTAKGEKDEGTTRYKVV